MVDVVLVLLIVLMVTAQYAASQALPLDLPKASSAETSPRPPLAISVDATGAIFLDGVKLSRTELVARIRAGGHAAERSALIAADGGAQHRAVVGVIDVLRTAGISKLSLNVAPEEPAPRSRRPSVTAAWQSASPCTAWRYWAAPTPAQRRDGLSSPSWKLRRLRLQWRLHLPRLRHRQPQNRSANLRLRQLQRRRPRRPQLRRPLRRQSQRHSNPSSRVAL